MFQILAAGVISAARALALRAADVDAAEALTFTQPRSKWSHCAPETNMDSHQPHSRMAGHRPQAAVLQIMTKARAATMTTLTAAKFIRLNLAAMKPSLTPCMLWQPKIRSKILGSNLSRQAPPPGPEPLRFQGSSRRLECTTCLP